MNNDRNNNKMGVLPIPKLVLSMSLPAILAMMVQATYNVVDSIFVSNISEEALTAVSLAFPVQMVIIAAFVGLGIGINSLVSRKLGEKDEKTATLVAEHGFLIGLVLYLLIAVIGATTARTFFGLFTEDLTIINYSTTYITIIMLFSFGRIFAQTGMSILQGTGEMVKPMIAQLIGAILNIILDPILIFGYLGFPAMGVKGAAIATVTAQIVSMIFILIVLFNGKNILKPSLKDFKIKGKIVLQIIAVGLPAAIMQGVASIMLTGFNLILAAFSDTAIAVMGVYFKLQSFVFMPIFGLSTGTMPIVGFNFGAKNKNRLISAVKFSTIIAVSFMTLGFIVFQLFPNQLLGMFNGTKAMFDIGIHAFKIISIMFPFAGISIIMSTAFQGLGKAHISLAISIVRQLVVLLPSAYLLGRIGGIDYVWYSFLIAELVGVTIVLITFTRTYRKSVSKWDDEQIVEAVEVPAE